jgi:hypothetical protein
MQELTLRIHKTNSFIYFKKIIFLNPLGNQIYIHLHFYIGLIFIKNHFPIVLIELFFWATL